jgi:hypothetical protein
VEVRSTTAAAAAEAPPLAIAAAGRSKSRDKSPAGIEIFLSVFMVLLIVLFFFDDILQAVIPGCTITPGRQNVPNAHESAISIKTMDPPTFFMVGFPRFTC